MRFHGVVFLLPFRCPSEDVVKVLEIAGRHPLMQLMAYSELFFYMPFKFCCIFFVDGSFNPTQVAVSCDERQEILQMRFRHLIGA